MNEARSSTELPRATGRIGPDTTAHAAGRIADGRTLRRRRVRLATVGSEAEQELDDRWWLGLRGSVLKSVDAQDFMVVLKFEGGFALTVESAANVRAASAPGNETTAVIHNEEGKLSTSDALTSLVGQRVLSSVGFKTGELRLVFESGQMLYVPHDPDYEAWKLTGPSGRMWVSLPGGGLATFPGGRS